MKKLIYYTLSMAAVFMLMTACETNDPIVFENEDSFIGFTNGNGAVTEAVIVDGEARENIIAIPVMLTTLDNNPVTVNFDFSVEGFAEEAQAIENETFTLLNESKSLSFTGGMVDGSVMGYDTIYIRTVDNEIFTGNKRVNIVLVDNSAGYDFGTQDSFTLTVVDNEHPLNIVLGTYAVTGSSAFDDSALSTTIQTSAVEGTLEQVSFPLAQLIPGWGVPPTDLVYAMVDPEAKTFRIQTGQAYATFGYGPSKISGYDAESGDLMEDGLFIEGTFDDDGTITLQDMIGVMITSGNNEGLSFEIWNPGSLWIKQAKKSVEASSVNKDASMLRRF